MEKEQAPSIFDDPPEPELVDDPPEQDLPESEPDTGDDNPRPFPEDPPDLEPAGSDTDGFVNVGQVAHQLLAADATRPESEDPEPVKPDASGDRKQNAFVLDVATRDLPVRLDDAALAERAGVAAERWSKLVDLEAEAASIRKGYAERIKEADAEFRSIMGVVASRMETRPVRCEEIPDWDTKTVKLVRTDLEPDDPRYVVERRGMRQNELQFPLQLGAPDAQPADGNPKATLPSEPHSFKPGRGRAKGTCSICGSDQEDPVHAEVKFAVGPGGYVTVDSVRFFNDDPSTALPNLEWLGHDFVGPRGTILCGEPGCGKDRASHGQRPPKEKVKKPPKGDNGKGKPKAKAKPKGPLARKARTSA